MGKQPKPTIAELETILADDPGAIQIEPNGSVTWVAGEPKHAQPKVFTLCEAMGDS